MATDRKLAALLELERRGKLPENLKSQLEIYRQQGIAKPLKDGAGGDATEGERKSAGFYTRAAGANRDFEATGGGAGLPARSMVGAAAASVFGDTVANANSSSERQLAEQAQRDFIAATLRYESGAAIPDTEFEAQRKIFFPAVGDGPAVLEQKARARQRAVSSLRLSAGGLASEADKLANPSADKPPPVAGTLTASRDGSSEFATPQDKAFATEAQALLESGGDRAAFDRLSLKYGAPAYGPDLDKAIAYRARGGKGATVTTPTTGAKGPSVLGALAATSGGAAITGVANAITGGSLDEIVGMTGGDQAQAELAKQVMARDHPYAYGGGEVAGAIGASLGAGGIAARALPALGAGATSLIGDAAYGTAFGAGENNDNRLGGAAVGGLGAAAGNLGGQALVRGVAGAIAPNVSESVRFLRDNGVRTTVGQSLGPTASRLEEKLVSVPVLGDLIRNGRQRALGDFNTGVMNDALGRVGGAIPDGVEGTAAMAHGQQVFDDAYSAARAQMQLIPDAQMATDLTDLSQRVASGQLSEASANRLGTIYQAEVMRRLGPNGSVSGDAYKTISSRLAALQRSTRQTDPELSGALGEMQGIIDQTARRSSPPEAAAAMDAADEGYALWTRVENAARMRGGDTAAFTPSQLDAAVQRGDGSVRSRSYLRGDALGQEWATAGKDILRDAVPNSGTADRGIAAALVGGVGVLNPKTLIPAGVLAGAYAPGVRDVLSGVIAAERGPGAMAAADALRLAAPTTGSFGTAFTLDALARR
ncbi:MAG: hypothetical protein ABWY12_12100 [Burkholderiales bacterium]